MKFRSDDQTASSPACASTRAPATPAPTSGTCGVAAGTSLATVTFTGETATGWQQATFATPVAITANTTYVASYYAPNGRYAADDGLLRDGRASTTRRCTRCATASTAPTASTGTAPAAASRPTRYQSTNYWVDVVFNTSADRHHAADGHRHRPRPPAPPACRPRTTVSATLQRAGAGRHGRPSALTAGGTPVAGTTAYDADHPDRDVHPASALAPSTTYTATRQRGEGHRRQHDGARTRGPSRRRPRGTAARARSGRPPRRRPPPRQPTTRAVELGVRFRANTAGFITGLRFYKGTGNTGTHIGSLWTHHRHPAGHGDVHRRDRDRLADRHLRPARSPVTANTTYVASYSHRRGLLLGHRQRLRLARGDPRPADRAGQRHRRRQRRLPVRRQRRSRPAPSSRRNYWVDVVFDTTATDTVAPTVVGRSPGARRDRRADQHHGHRDLQRAGHRRLAST